MNRIGYLVFALVAVAQPAAVAPPQANAAEEPNVRVVNMVAERFFFVPSRIKVKPGTKVELRIRSADTNHGFRIRKAGINVVVPKRGAGEAKVVFHATKKGRYDFECSKACGAGHNTMRGTIIVK
jgi:cytochrome c oxidase subunit 2